MFELRFMPPVEKYFKKLKEKKLISEYNDALDKIAADPYNAGEAKTGDLVGIYCCNIYHNKINYEIAYKIIDDGEQIAILILAGTRENFYKELKRYMNL